MVITKRSIKQLTNEINKRIQEFYQNGYFYVDSATLYFDGLSGGDKIVCVAGYKINDPNNSDVDDYKQVRFAFTMSAAVKSIKENAAVIALYAIDKLDEYSSFRD